MANRAISLRLPEQMATELAAIARTKDVPISEVIREAIESHITALGKDEDFRRRLKQHLEEELEVLERLAK
jgi:predicted DNA-binding protein